jgi:hypothetical protein
MVCLQRVEVRGVVVLPFDPFEAFVTGHNCYLCVAADGVSPELESKEAPGMPRHRWVPGSSPGMTARVVN